MPARAGAGETILRRPHRGFAEKVLKLNNLEPLWDLRSAGWEAMPAVGGKDV